MIDDFHYYGPAFLHEYLNPSEPQDLDPTDIQVLVEAKDSLQKIGFYNLICDHLLNRTEAAAEVARTFARRVEACPRDWEDMRVESHARDPYSNYVSFRLNTQVWDVIKDLFEPQGYYGKHTLKDTSDLGQSKVEVLYEIEFTRDDWARYEHDKLAHEEIVPSSLVLRVYPKYNEA